KHTTSDIWVLPLPGGLTPTQYSATPFAKWSGRFSPDGRWVAYVADDTGGSDVYVQAFPATSRRWRVSTSGGDDPQWRRDGRELFYVAANGWLTAVAVTDHGESISFGAPQTLFRIPMKYTLLRNRYSVGADGNHFLVDLPVDEDAGVPMTVIVNW